MSLNQGVKDVSSPRVSVLLAVYNGGEFLKTALDSLCHQTFADFEIIAVNDGSVDDTGAILTTAASVDPRIRILSNETNRGLAFSLNRAIDAARGSLLARMDADDEAVPDRVEKQVREFDRDPNLILLGSNVDVVDATGKHLWVSNYPQGDALIRCISLLENPFAHPAVMMRAEPFSRHQLRYDESFDAAQDWDLWTRLFQFGLAQNLPEPLVRRRVHDQAISTRSRDRQVRNALRVMEKYISSTLGADVWDRAKFLSIIEGFLGDRHEADRQGINRVVAASYVLDLLRLWRDRRPELYVRRYESEILWRVVRTGFAPPFCPGALKLLARLLLEYPTFAPELSARMAWAGLTLCFR